MKKRDLEKLVHKLIMCSFVTIVFGILIYSCGIKPLMKLDNAAKEFCKSVGAEKVTAYEEPKNALLNDNRYIECDGQGYNVMISSYCIKYSNHLGDCAEYDVTLSQVRWV